jgi:hypothetical protein
MYRITSILDLDDPASDLGGNEVASVHLVQIIGQPAMFAVIAFKNHQAALVPCGRLGLRDAEGARALESFRRWLKQREVPLGKAGLRYAEPGADGRVLAEGAFSVAEHCVAHDDPAISASFQEWATSRSVTPVGARTI